MATLSQLFSSGRYQGCVHARYREMIEACHLRKFGHEPRHGVRRVHRAQSHIEETATHRRDTVGLFVFDAGIASKSCFLNRGSKSSRHASTIACCSAGKSGPPRSEYGEKEPSSLEEVVPDHSFQVGEGVFLVGEGHGIEEFLLKILLDGQFHILHLSGNVIRLVSFSQV